MSDANNTTRTPADSHDHGQAQGEHHPHVVPLSLLTGIFIVLLILTVITVAVTQIDLGPLNVWVALFIAVIKGVLVALYFMHLRWDSPFNSMILTAALLFVALFIAISLMDSFEYRRNYQPPTDVPTATG